MKERLRQYCRSIGIEHMGIAPPGPYGELGVLLKARRREGRYTEFEEPDIQKRIQPSLEMPEVQSVVVCLFPYYTGEQEPCNLARYTYAQDYHILVKEKLEKLGHFLEGEIAGFAYKSYADNGPLADRYLAYLAGLGFYGMNSQFIHEQYGSYVFIGYLLTNYPFAPDTPQQTSCLECGRCIKACPGRAIVGDKGLEPSLCRSYLTQKKGDLSLEEQAVIKSSVVIFGCDICQEVCPHNEQVPVTPLKEFKEGLQPFLSCEEVATLSNKEFKKRYGNRAFSWRGKNILLRNDLIIKGVTACPNCHPSKP